MKFIKYLAIALLFGATLSSCEQQDAGKTTVEFADAVYKTSFGVGTFYLPMIITADNEADMNGGSVQAKLIVVEDYTPSADAVHGKANIDGLEGDYMITALDADALKYTVNFPAYSDYYDKKAPEQYFDAELGKWVKKVGLEIQILNTEPDVMEFKLAIESATTTIGAVNECVIRIEKGPQDMLCGDWYIYHGGSPLGSGAPSPYKATFGWNADRVGFDVRTDLYPVPLFFSFNPVSAEVTLAHNIYLGAISGYYVQQVVYGVNSEGQLVQPSMTKFVAQYADDYSTLVFPDLVDLFVGEYAYADEAMTQGLGFLEGLWEIAFARDGNLQAPAQVAPVKSEPFKIISKEQFEANIKAAIAK